MDAHTTDELSVRALYRDLLTQWNKRNAAAMAGLFMPDGNLVGFDGSQLNGQKEIYDVFVDIFEHFPTAAYIAIVKEVRLLSPETAVLLSVAGMVPEGTDDISPAVNAIQSITATKDNDVWRIALFQNTPAAYHGRPNLSEQLSADLRAALHAAN